MPDMNGFETTNIIREKEGNKKTPIIAMTAYEMFSDRKKCIDAGMDEYISKPFSLDELSAKIEKYLRPSQSL